MEQVEKSVNKWKRKEDFTRREVGRVFGTIYGMAAGFILGILYDSVFKYFVIFGVIGFILGGVIGAQFKNSKKIRAYVKEHPGITEEELLHLTIKDENEEKKL